MEWGWPPIFATAGVVLAGFSLALLAQRKFGVKSESLVLSLFFAPVVAYLIFSRQLSDFSGFGFELKFVAASREAIADTVATANIDVLQVKDDLPLELKAYISLGSPVVIIKVGEAPEKEKAQGVKRNLAKHIRDSMAIGAFDLLIVLDKDNRVLGYFPQYFFSDLARIHFEHTVVAENLRRFYPTRDQVDYLIQQSEFNLIFDHPAVRADLQGIKHVVNEKTSNIDALKLMARERLDALVVTDGRGRYKGFLRKDDVLARILIGSFERSQDGVSRNPSK